MKLTLFCMVFVFWLVAFQFGIVKHHVVEDPKGIFLRRIVRWPIMVVIYAYFGVGVLVGTLSGCFSFWTPFMVAEMTRNPQLKALVFTLWSTFISSAGVVVMFMWGDIFEEKRDRNGSPKSKRHEAAYGRV